MKKFKPNFNPRIRFDTKVKLVLILLVCSPNVLSLQIVSPNQNGAVEGYFDASDDSHEDTRDIHEGHRNDYIAPYGQPKLHKVPPGIYSVSKNGETRAFTNALLKAIAKRTAYANSEEEIEQKDPGVGIGLVRKRSEMEWHGGGCVATRFWMQLDSDHYPKFIKSFTCSSDRCNQNFGDCHPKVYTVLVLKRNTPSLSEQECDQQLPQQLRCDWKLQGVNVTTYCECIPSMSVFGR